MMMQELWNSTSSSTPAYPNAQWTIGGTGPYNAVPVVLSDAFYASGISGCPKLLSDCAQMTWKNTFPFARICPSSLNSQFPYGLYSVLVILQSVDGGNAVVSLANGSFAPACTSNPALPEYFSTNWPQPPPSPGGTYGATGSSTSVGNTSTVFFKSYFMYQGVNSYLFYNQTDPVVSSNSGSNLPVTVQGIVFDYGVTPWSGTRPVFQPPLPSGPSGGMSISLLNTPNWTNPPN